jgi:hypothetical protein
LKKIDTVVWANDFSENTGEGRLSRDFIFKFLEYKPKVIIKIKTFQQEFYLRKNKILTKKNIYKNSFIDKYITFFYGIIYLWINYKKRILYINYLPLWNFFIFLLIPSKTILGPITGGVHPIKIDSIASIVRKIFFPVFYRISLFIIYIKFKKVIFSTNLLKKYILRNNNFFFGYAYNLFLFNNNSVKKKKFDLIFYNRNYQSKKNNLVKRIISNLKEEYKICIVGDKFEGKNFFNYGFVPHKKVINLIRESKIAFASSENIFSLFAIDCYNSKVKLIYDKRSLFQNVISKKNSILVDYSKPTLSAKKINYELTKCKFKKDIFFSKYLNKKKKELNNFLEYYFL